MTSKMCQTPMCSKCELRKINRQIDSEHLGDLSWENKADLKVKEENQVVAGLKFFTLKINSLKGTLWI